MKIDCKNSFNHANQNNNKKYINIEEKYKLPPRIARAPMTMPMAVAINQGKVWPVPSPGFFAAEGNYKKN